MILSNHREPSFNFAAPYLQLPTGDGSLPSHESPYEDSFCFRRSLTTFVRWSVSNERDLIDCRLTPLAILDKPFFDDMRSLDGFKRVKIFSALILAHALTRLDHHRSMITTRTHQPISLAPRDRSSLRSEAQPAHRSPHSKS